MNKKYAKLELENGIDFKKLLKYEYIEELRWFEEELNELYLYKNKYNKTEVNKAKYIIRRMEQLQDLCVDRQLDYLIQRTLRSVKNLYPEFFEI